MYISSADSTSTRICGMFRFELHRTCYQCHLRSATGTFFCQRKSHLSGRIIADETHRVNLFVSRSGCNHHFLPDSSSLEAKNSSNTRMMFPALPYVPSLPSGWLILLSRLDNMITVGTQNIQIFLGGRMGKHIEVHCRSNKHGSFCRKISCYQHIVGYSVGHFTDSRGSGRCNQYGIRPQPRSTWLFHVPSRWAKNSLMTGLLVKAERVMGVINSFPAGVITTCTSAPVLSVRE